MPGQSTKSSDPSLKYQLVGIAAALGAVVIWAAWIVGTRQAVTHALTPAAMGFLRFGLPALVFAPVWWRGGLMPRGIALSTTLGLMGAGAPFFIIVAAAMRHAPAAVIGPLLPGTMPLIVALLSTLLLGERMSRLGRIGLVLVGLGIAAIGGEDLVGGARNWSSYLLLLAGAAMWACYTIAYKRSGLSSLTATALVSVWSALCLAPFGIPDLIAALRDGFGGAVMAQAAIQGILSGVVAIVLYGIAVSRLGASVAAAFVALVPGLAAVIAIKVLGEVPSTGAMIGLVATTLGVMLMTGAGLQILRRIGGYGDPAGSGTALPAVTAR